MVLEKGVNLEGRVSFSSQADIIIKPSGRVINTLNISGNYDILQ
jgi:hypothetical protein